MTEIWDMDWQTADPRPRLGAIRQVLHVVADVGAVAGIYEDVLGYRQLAEGVVTAAEAGWWKAPAMAGRRSVTLGPQSGEPVTMRFVESPSAKGWRALTTHGWNATEIVVQDVDALSARLAKSDAFRIIGPVKGLTRFPMIRAMQVLGPAGECLYFTEVGPGSGLDLAPALSFVGRVFIVVAGGADVNEMFRAYAGFGNAIDPPVSTPVNVISLANDLPLETLHPHGLIKLPEGTMIELDGYPDVTRPRPVPVGELPPGMAMVSFAGAGAMIMRGAAGEVVELVEERG
jgi:hypothetical protein